MCHAYSITTNVEALRALRFTFEVASNIGNLAPQTGVYPDMLAPIIRNAPGGFRELVKVRWGMPSSSRALYLAAKDRANKLIQKMGHDISPDEFEEMVRLEPDRGTHNVRNTDSAHWKRWLRPEFRCIVPFTSFAEFSSRVGADGKKQGNTWFAFDADRPLGWFAGIYAPQWTSVRKTSEGMITTDLFAFLTTEPNDVVAGANPDSMPVILTMPDEIETWLTAPWEVARQLQRPLPRGALRIVATGAKEDPDPNAADLTLI
ncbi:SOS response-associated peptidase [bacterium]|nr:MAG: SOS response-associated peptidase [bacterium]